MAIHPHIEMDITT